MNNHEKEKPKGKVFNWKRLIPFCIIIAVLVVLYFTGVGKYLSFETLKKHRERIMDFVNNHKVLTPILYITIYTIAIAISIPGALFLTIFGGFIFGQPMSTIYVVIGATAGAAILFLAAKTALGEFLRKKASGKILDKMRTGFQDNAISYMLFLRLVPLFPFWLVNLAPAFFGVKLWTFTWTTFLGIIPGSFVYAQAGTGIGALLDTEGKFSIEAIFNWQTRIALIALGIFALIPILIKKIRKSFKKSDDNKNAG